MASNSSPTKDLLKAAASGDVDSVARLISEGVPVDSVSDEYSGTPVTPLWLASMYGRGSIVEYLLSQSAVIDVQKTNGMMPLHVACEEGHLDVVKVLIKNGAKFDSTAVDWMLMTPLHFASQRCHLEVARHLISLGADVHAVNRNKATPLHLASSMNIAEELLKSGADVNALDSNNATPLIVACMSATVGVVSCLLDHKSDIDAVDKFGRTAFLEAARSGNTPVVDLLLTKGVNINQTSKPDNFTALMLAAQGSHMGTVKILLKNRIDIEAKTKDGRNVLDVGLEAVKRLEGDQKAHVSEFLRHMREVKGLKPNSGATKLPAKKK